MRIISGKLSRFRFNPPKGFDSRPTTNFAKEGLFNILHHQFEIKGLKILDLYCGTGNITFEFASRDASVTAVDKNYKCTSFIKQTANKCKVEDQVTTIRSDVFKFLKENTTKFDVVFADPPFDFEKYEELVEAVATSKSLAGDNLFVLEHSKRVNLSHLDGFQESRKYGGVTFSFFKFNES